MRMWEKLLLGGVAALVTALVPMSGATAEDQEPGIYPGLPFVPCSYDIKGEGVPSENLSCDFVGPTATNDYSWLNFPQVGLAGSVKAKQWTKVPISMMASTIELISAPDPANNISNQYWYKVQAFFVSPTGSKQNYGNSQPITVRTVAFGSVPAEITLQVSQRRDGNGLPRPLVLRPHDYVNPLSPNVDRQTVDPATIRDLVNVRVLDLKVDGVPVRLGTSCQTGSRSEIVLSSKELVVTTDYNTWDQSLGTDRLVGEFDPTTYQYGLYGGTLDGSIDIQPFSGCSTSTGDDVSRLLTSALSGPDNPLAVRIGAAGGCTSYDENGHSLPTAPDAATPAKACPVTDLGYPNKQIVVIPKEFDIPDQAPSPTSN
ncbi:hypothetical protein ASD11_16750 [Aeromicrobium sp. Root495]|uniref:hypothetical protein n=1 Tax=Aeromicrobium sp. Root495 TaxID=1736550 RepID=UPI0006FC0A49|nr:hypothetical protein [Aeromicrobium sp. Root495]KQY56112.1 hypothetical protein ASD11_16750 [Aeromicrobium sp. Root495]